MFIKKAISVLITLIICMSSSALQHNVDSLLLALRNSDLPSDKVEILNKLAKTFATSDVVRSENYAKQALFISESIEYEFGKSEAFYNLGVLAFSDNKYALAMDFFANAKEGFYDLKEEKWLAKVNLYLSRLYKRNLEYEKAISLLFQSMETFRKLNKKKKMAETYNALGGNFYDQGNYDRAFEYYENSMDLYQELNDRKGMGSLYNNLGELYRFNKDYDKAISYYKKSMDIFLEDNHTINLSAIYNNLGNAYLETNRPDSAIHFLELGLELSNLSKSSNSMSSIRISLGKYYQFIEDFTSAESVLKEGYDLAVENNDMQNIIAASQELSGLFENKNDFKKAYRYYAQFRSNMDSLHKKSNLEKITQLEMNLLFDLENEVRDIQTQRTNLRYFTIAVILISLIILLVLLYGRQRIKVQQSRVKAENLQMERIRLQEDIDYKNRELATNVMYLVKKNELINFITEKLLKGKTNFKPAIRQTIDDIILDLQSNADENIWQVFQDRFMEVHIDFYKNLDIQFPKLTDNDRKLCAFIKLDMNTKEIAAITHQNPNSIEVARTRLRKKLNISNKDISLNNFLSQI